MKENRFIELLNLYIDRQITAEETAELEAELQRNPKRQSVYRQYCKIHSATKLVYESFRAEAADQPVPRPGHAGVVELFETRRRRNHWAYFTTAGLAAAAALALVFVLNRTPAGQPAAPVLAAQPDQTAVPAVVAAAAPVPAATPAPATEPGMVSLRNAVEMTPDYAAMIAVLREQDEERAFSNERLQIGRVQPLFPDDMFAPRRLLSAQEQRTFRSQPAVTPSSSQQAEFSAFQFQR